MASFPSNQDLGFAPDWAERAALPQTSEASAYNGSSGADAILPREAFAAAQAALAFGADTRSALMFGGRLKQAEQLGIDPYTIGIGVGPGYF